MKIVLPSDPTVVEVFAANELARCMQASVGWSVVRGSEKEKPESAVIFYVGSIDRKRMAEAGFPVEQITRATEKLAEDGAYIKGAKQSVVLVGKGRRGALNAVYDFLENTIGCHWPEPGREYIPKHESISLEGISRKVSPTFYWRGIAIHGACNPQWFGKIVDWLAKNRMNSFQLHPPHYEQVRPAVLDDILKRGLMPNIGGHSREFYYPSAKYFPANPEYFALVKGKRTAESQICYSEYGSIPEYAANIVAYVKSRPEISIASVWPSDGFGFCECDKCKSRQTTDVILDYANRLSEAVHKQLPEIKTEFLSYIHYTTPPTGIKPLEYVIPSYCEYWSRSQFQPITEDKYESKRLRKELQGWIGVSHQATIFSYYGDDCIKRYLYNPVPDVVIEDIHYYKKIGLAGNFVLLTNPESWWSNAPHIYAYTRAAWDIKVKIDQVNDDYYDSLYGSLSETMQEHARACRELFELRTPQGTSGQDLLFNMGFTKFDADMDNSTRKQLDAATTKIIATLDKAGKQSRDAYVSEKIRKLRDDAEYVKLITQLLCDYSMFKTKNDTVYKDSCIGKIEQALALEVMRIDDKNGYRTGNERLVAIARDLVGDDAVWLSVSAKDRDEYADNGIWRWKTEDIVPSSVQNPRKIVIDVTKRIQSSGTYEVRWDYLMGADGLMIESTGIYSGADESDLRPISIDTHHAFTGGGDMDNVYRMKIDNYDPTTKYYVVGLVYDDRTYDTFGQVLFTKAQ